MAEARRRLAAALAAPLLLASCASPEVTEGELKGTAIEPAWAVPDVAGLTDDDGTAYSLVEDTAKPVTLVFFGYTNCPDICSMVMNNVTQAIARVPGAEEKVDVVFVTTDPARDTGPVLQRYLGAFDEGYVGVTGQLPAVQEAAKGFHVAFEEGDRLPSGGYDVTHQDNVFVVDDKDEITLFWRRTLSPVEMAHDLEQLVGED